MLKAAVVLLVCGVMFVACAAVAGAPAEQEDGAQRSERSANLSHITGTARKIRMFVKNRILQIMPDGAVNGSSDDTSHYSILQRQSVAVGQVKIQGVATCMYLCMDPCGIAYGSRDFGEECIFNENIEQHHYNTYAATKYSNHRRTVYLALSRRGVPRRVQIKAKSPLGKLSTYTNVLTQTVPADEVEALARRLLGALPGGPTGAHHLRHHHQLCPPAPTRAPHTPPPDLERCRKRKKRRKRRRCREGEDENEDCHKAKVVIAEEGKKRVVVRRRCEEGEGKEKCQQKKQHMIGRKRKSRHETKRLLRHLPHPRSHARSEEEDSEEVHEDPLDHGAHEDHEDHEAAADDDDEATDHPETND